MPNARLLDATDLAALMPPKEAVALLQAALARGATGLQWSAEAAAPAPAGTSALLEGGAPKLIVDRAAFIALRGAATTGLLSARLADPRTEVLTLLGCNAIGRASFEVVHATFPALERVLLYDPDVNIQAAFADEIMTTFNVASIIPTDPREACEGAHILVNCPSTPPKSAIIEFDWLQSGTVIVMLAAGAAFTDDMLARAQRRIVDDLPTFAAAQAAGRFKGVPEPEGDLAALAAGRLPPRSGKPVVASISFGAPAVDAALAAELLARAEKAGRGRTLAS